MSNMTVDKLQELTDILDRASIPTEDRMGVLWDEKRGEYVLFNSEGFVCQQSEG